MTDIRKALKEALPDLKLKLSLDARGILTLTGEAGSWEEVVAAGHLAAGFPGIKNVVNELSVRGQPVFRKDYAPHKERGMKAGLLDKVDVLIIGTGITGCAIARELSKYQINLLAVDKGDDVATGATKANNGNIHPGHDVKPGTLKAKLNTLGNELYTHWAEELGFELQRCGLMGAVTDINLRPALEKAAEGARAMGVFRPEVVDGKRAKELEPGFAEQGIEPAAALWLPSMGLVEPYKVAVALAENAAVNGARFLFNCTVADIRTQNGRVAGALTSRGFIEAPYIINCAGVYADEISAMAGDKCFTIHPRKGVIAILDKNRKPVFNALAGVIGNSPKKKSSESKGGGMCRTPEGNVLMGPSATEVPDKEDLSTTPEGLDYAMSLGLDYGINKGDIIRFFTGSRPADYKEDFFIEASTVTGGFINVGGIQSPGLAAAPAVALLVEEIFTGLAAQDGFALPGNPRFNPRREREKEFRHLNREEQDELIRQNPAYGRIICRCESITEGEILDAIASPVPPASVDAIKRRTRAGMGRCQGGFCQPRVVELLARERGLELTAVTLRGEGTNILVADTRPYAEAGEL
ncbi:MAG: FAD-dependent oxidoreductase [Spirochaetales bacterium]|jgi:glycerol-3-phosphate dehydrogenase|nr:FAD-dependent oxidoreductase [Spirochaetales bacterium]